MEKDSQSKSNETSKGLLAGLGFAGGLTLGPIIVIIVLLLACAICCIVFAVFGSSDINTSSDNTTEEESENEDESKPTNTPKPMPKIGELVRDGKFEFKVNSLKCGVSKVGSNQYLQQTAQGQYCLLNVTVKNIGNEAQLMASSNQYLIDKAGRELSSDSTATTYYDTKGDLWINEINPGNSVTGTIVFDVAKDAEISKAKLHDSAFSGGVEVSLTK